MVISIQCSVVLETNCVATCPSMVGLGSGSADEEQRLCCEKAGQRSAFQLQERAGNMVPILQCCSGMGTRQSPILFQWIYSLRGCCLDLQLLDFIWGAGNCCNAFSCAVDRAGKNNKPQHMNTSAQVQFETCLPPIAWGKHCDC